MCVDREYRTAPWGWKGGLPMTVEIQEQSLWLIPFVLAICFLVWVLWGLLKEQSRQKDANSRVIRTEFILPNARHADHEPLLRFRH